MMYAALVCVSFIAGVCFAIIVGPGECVCSDCRRGRWKIGIEP